MKKVEALIPAFIVAIFAVIVGVIVWYQDRIEKKAGREGEGKYIV